MNIEETEYNTIFTYGIHVLVVSANRIDGIGLIGESWLTVDGMDVPNDRCRESSRMERRAPRVCHDGTPSLFVKA